MPGSLGRQTQSNGGISSLLLSILRSGDTYVMSLATYVNTSPPAMVGSPQFPAFASLLPASTRTALDQALSELQAHKETWIALSLVERMRLLDEALHDLGAVAARWVAASLEAKGVSAGGFAEAEEWIILGAVFSMVRRHRKVLADIHSDGSPRLPGPLRLNPDGQVVVRVFPTSRLESMVLMGMRADTWLEPGVRPEDAIQVPPFLRQGRQAGTVVLVLGAGNAGHLPLADVLSKMFTEGQVALLKMNPVNDYLGPLYEQAFQSLIRAGFLRIVYGGTDVGSYLCKHRDVDAIHLTGSDKTYDAIVFGTGAEGAARKAAGTPLNTKPFTAELGGVNPVIIVPGPWNQREIRAKAAQLAAFIWSNAASSCLTPRLLIQQQGWAGREQLIKETGKALAHAGVRPAYYPGAHERHAAFQATYPDALRFGEAASESPPWALILDVDATRPDAMAFRCESFCGVCAETALAAGDTASFIRKAVEFANQTVWGNLTATLLVHPRSLKDRQVASALDDAIARLRYGTVTVNSYPALAHVTMLPPWGAFPGNEPQAIQSGAGKVFNFYHLQRPQKSVVWAPFGGLNPLTLSSKHVALLGRRMEAFAANPSPSTLLSTIMVALRG